MPRGRDAVAPPVDVVYLEHDLHPHAPALGRDVPPEITALLGQLRHRPYAEYDVTQAEAGIAAGLKASDLERQNPCVEGDGRLHVLYEKLQAQSGLTPHLRCLLVLVFASGGGGSLYPSPPPPTATPKPTHPTTRRPRAPSVHRRAFGKRAEGLYGSQPGGDHVSGKSKHSGKGAHDGSARSSRIAPERGVRSPRSGAVARRLCRQPRRGDGLVSLWAGALPPWSIFPGAVAQVREVRPHLR